MSNTERQRKFRAAHPGYYNKYYYRRKHANVAATLALIAAREARAAQVAQASEPLLLPAPVEPLVLPNPTPAASISLEAHLPDGDGDATQLRFDFAIPPAKAA